VLVEVGDGSNVEVGLAAIVGEGVLVGVAVEVCVEVNVDVLVAV
jgi:hypothetical protein